MTLNELSITLLENIYSTGITHEITIVIVLEKKLQVYCQMLSVMSDACTVNDLEERN